MAVNVTEFNVGRWCLSEEECIAQDINFAAYERGVSDAAKAFSGNPSPLSDESEFDRLFRILRGSGYVTSNQACELCYELMRKEPK
jgi:hypothetical protein